MSIGGKVFICSMCAKADRLHFLGHIIDASPLQQLTLARVESFSPHLLERLALPSFWCDSHAGHHLIIHAVDKSCCSFRYEMIGPEASGCVFFKLGVVTVL